MCVCVCVCVCVAIYIMGETDFTQASPFLSVYRVNLRSISRYILTLMRSATASA